MGELSIIDRVRITLAGWAFLLSGRLWPEIYDVWLDDAPRKTHLPGDDEFGAEAEPTLDEGRATRLRVAVLSAIDNIQHGRTGAAVAGLRSARSLDDAALAAQERETTT